MNQSFLRQRLRVLNNDRPKPSPGSEEGSQNERECSSESPLDRIQKSQANLVHKDDASSPSSYDSSPDSGEESDGDAAAAVAAAPVSQEGAAPVPHIPPPARPSDNDDGEGGPSSKAWYEFDLSVMLALVSPIGNWLTGGDHVKNLLLVLLLIFYLHQIIEVPWNLYHSSRPRHRSYLPSDQSLSAEDRYRRDIASSKLRTLEIFYLTMTVLSPFLGVILLRTILSSLSGSSSISWFSTSLFVLATGLRPWKHVVERLRERTNDFHNVIHYPPSELGKIQSQLDLLTERVALLEAQFKVSQARFDSLSTEAYEHVEETYGAIEKATRRHEQRTLATKSAHEARLSKLEKDVETLLERREIRTDAYEPVFLTFLKQRLFAILPAWLSGNTPPKSPVRPLRASRSRSSSIKLETIPERATFQPGSPDWVSSFRIPGLRLVLRIGDLATLPVRRVVGYLLSERIYSPRRPTPFP